ncbi:hypothetical protein HHI36_005393 [Cryptolaemus montrouzieri]|uniref:Uncharacterized protein n=1 Tax=Cryptolaemus montrouzieri TaxID=559131 RepID=A0ABD2NUB8_9CUCU
MDMTDTGGTDTFPLVPDYLSEKGLAIWNKISEKEPVCTNELDLLSKEIDNFKTNLSLTQDNNALEETETMTGILENKIVGIREISRKGANKVAVEFKTWVEANQFVVKNFLEKENFAIFVPTLVL